MLRILQQPYPFGEKSNTRLLIQSIGEGAFIAFFLIFFQPFGISEWQDPNKNWYLASYGIITALCGMILRFVVFKAFPKYHSETTWNVGKEILSVMLLILMIAAGNVVFSGLVFKLNNGISSFFWMLLVVMTIGIFPATFGVMLNYIIQLKKYNQPIIVQHFTQPTENKPVIESKALKLMAENEKDFLEFDAENLFYIESSDNYSTVCFEKNQKLQKELLRSSLTRLEGQISTENIVRCHRSFIVNLDKVEKITGNAQGYKLHLTIPELLVPVARKYSEVVERLK
ncbi:MAG: LytTR family DNA-binding domain-containing protein [Emticicia sp.]|nr:LytTR family DNA-binding domain-containing protein [Emticicia sp.]